MFANKVVESTLVAALALLLVGVAACESGTNSEVPAASAPPQVEGSSEAGRADGEQGPRRAVFSDELPYAEIDDELVYGHFVFPSDMIDPLPAVVMIHERWGLTDTIRARADELAAEGYIVLAVDLFKRKTTRSPAEARVFMAEAIENPDSLAENVRNAIQFVSMTAGAPRTAVLGWGFGGTWAVHTASLMPDEVNAAIIYYGQVTTDEEKLRPVTAPILGLFGGKDRAVKLESVGELRVSLERLRKDFEIEIYPEAGSGFANPSSNKYDPVAAADAWRRTLEFLETHLAAASGEGS